jgi:uncharacterized protein (DUF433 family)
LEENDNSSIAEAADKIVALMGRCHMNWRDRISIDPRIRHGKPCIQGTRVPASVIVGTIAEGHTPGQIIESWPQLSREDVDAALRFAAVLAANADRIPMEVDDEVDASSDQVG